jgi:DNA polymerase-3 subunit alpha
MMAMLQLDDTRGLAEVMVFPRVYAKCSRCVREDAVLKVKGKVEMKEGIPRLVALEIEELRLEPGPDPVYLRADAFEGLARPVAHAAFELLGRHPGESPLFLVSGDGTLKKRIGGIHDSSDLHAELKQLLGPRCLTYDPPNPEAVQEQEMEQVS